MLVHAGDGDHHVAISGDKECRDRYRSRLRKAPAAPSAVDIAIIIEGARENRCA